MLDAAGRGSGVRFADATAHAPLTYPSHAAILTGRYPANFGVRLNGMDPLPAAATTLAERLKAAGYRTGAVVAQRRPRAERRPRRRDSTSTTTASRSAEPRPIALRTCSGRPSR